MLVFNSYVWPNSAPLRDISIHVKASSSVSRGQCFLGHSGKISKCQILKKNNTKFEKSQKKKITFVTIVGYKGSEKFEKKNNLKIYMKSGVLKISKTKIIRYNQQEEPWTLA